MSGSLYGQFETPVYRSIPDLLETPREELSFREKHRIRIFDQFEPITETDLYPVDSLPLVDRGVQTTPLPDITRTADTKNEAEAAAPALKERSMTWQWPRLRPNDTYRVIRRVRDAQAENTYGFAYYSELAREELSRSPTMVKPSRSGPKPTKRARLVPLESASCGIAMEVAQADSKTNWEALMNHINGSIRDTQQQRMLGQYMIQKLKREQTMINIPPDQAATNKRCLESLIERYGTGLEGVVSKEREFERLIEAYQVFMRGDKKKMQRKVERKQQNSRKLKPADEPLPAIGDQKAGRSQVGCKIRHELRREYGEKVRLDFANRTTSSKRIILTQPGVAPKPMQVRVRKSVMSGQEPKEEEHIEDRACDEMDLPPTPISHSHREVEETVDQGLQETESQLSMTYVPSENQSLAQLIPEDGSGITVEIKPEEETPEEKETQQEPSPIEEEPFKGEREELETDKEVEASASEECLVLEGDSDPNVLIVNSRTELIPSHPALSPKFEIVAAESLVEKEREEKESHVAELEEEKPETKELREEEPVAKPEPAVAEKEEAPEPTVEFTVANKVAEPAPEVAPAEEPERAPEAEVSEDTKEPELEKLVEGPEEGPEIYQTVAIDLVNGILEKLDIEATTDDSKKPDLKEVHFKSSPEIVFYEKQSPEAELAWNPDDKLILSEDLSTAETELPEDAKPLYHKVLSTAHTEHEVLAKQKPREENVPTAQEDSEELTKLARELTDTAIKNAAEKSEEPKQTEEVRSDSAITATAKMLTAAALEKASSAV